MATAYASIGTPTPHCACIEVTSNGVAGGTVLGNTALLALCAAGPLRTALAAAVANTGAARARCLYGNPISIEIDRHVVTTDGWCVDVAEAAGVITLTATPPVANEVVVVRLTYRHSAVA